MEAANDQVLKYQQEFETWATNQGLELDKYANPDVYGYTYSSNRTAIAYAAWRGAIESFPSPVIAIPDMETWNEEQIREFQEHWNTMLSSGKITFHRVTDIDNVFAHMEKSVIEKAAKECGIREGEHYSDFIRRLYSEGRPKDTTGEEPLPTGPYPNLDAYDFGRPTGTGEFRFGCDSEATANALSRLIATVKLGLVILQKITVRSEAKIDDFVATTLTIDLVEKQKRGT
jgi:hypothetical protein